MRTKTDHEFICAWAVENGWTIEAGYCQSRPPGIVILCKSEQVCMYRGETLELAFSRMASTLKGEDSYR